MLNNPKVKFVKISRRHFDIITPKDNNTIYFIEENSGETTLNLGDKQITVGRFSNEELLELIEGKQESRPNGTDLLVIDGKINPLYIEYIENDIDSIKLKDIEQDNRLDIIESDIEDIEINVQTNTNDITNLEAEVEDIKEDYVTEVALDLQLLEKLNIRPNGTDLLIIGGMINPLYIDDTSYKVNHPIVNSQADMLTLDVPVGTVVVRSDTPNKELFLLTQLPASTLANWQVVSSNTVVSVAGKTGVVVLGITDVDGLTQALNLKLDATTFINEVSRLEGLIDGKAAKADVYTKTEVDTLLDTKANNENLAGPDLTGKEYLGDGVYRINELKTVTLDYNVFNGEWIVNGTPTSGNNFTIGLSLFNTNIRGDVAISFIQTSGDYTGGAVYIYPSATVTVNNESEFVKNLSTDFTITYNRTLGSRITLGFNIVTFNNFTFKLQLEKGTTATPYQVPLQPIRQHIENRLDTLDTSKQDKLVAGENITIEDNVISASGGGIDLDEIGYMNHASKIFYDSIKQNQFKDAWEHSLTVDPSEISEKSTYPDYRGIAQYPNGETEGVIIPNSVTSIGELAFSEWSLNNQPLVIPNSVTSIGVAAFYGWESNNQPLVIPNGTTSIGDYTFTNWTSNNKSLVLPNSVTSIGSFTFQNWTSNNKSLVIPNSVTSIGNNTFENWTSNNQPLVIPDSVTSIGQYAFSGWTSNNQPLVIPNSVTSIGNNAFERWTSNNQPLVIPDSVTSIGAFTFSGWESNNQPLVIPNSVTSIGHGAFLNWSNVPYIEMKSATPPTINIMDPFGGQNDAPIYVPDGSVDDYKNATNWSALSGRIFSINEK